MKAFSSRFWRRQGAVALFSLTLLPGLCGQVVAGPGDSTPRSPVSPIRAVQAHSFPNASLGTRVKASLPVAASNWLNTLMTKLESWLNNRTHMIQFCAIAMVIGLLIIWWRKT
jgi:hypothetical protein